MSRLRAVLWMVWHRPDWSNVAGTVEEDHLVQLTAETSGGRLPSFSPQNSCECPLMVKGKVFDDNAAWFKCCHTCHSHRSSKIKSKSWNNNGLQGQGFGFDWASHCWLIQSEVRSIFHTAWWKLDIFFHGDEVALIFFCFTTFYLLQVLQTLDPLWLFVFHLFVHAIARPPLADVVVL